MNYRPLQPTPSETRSTISLGLIVIAVFLVVAILAGLLSPQKDILSIYLTIIASICILAGIVGLYVVAARLFGFWLPQILRMHEKSWDQNWQVLALSIIAIIFPLIMLMMHRIIHVAIFH
jgi:antibiotic biosynthesis monooxygenase (ABM) superfamily enzyme